MALGDYKDVSSEKRTGLTYKGQEILLSKQRGRPMNGMTAVAMDRGIYPEIKKVEAASLYAVTGDLKQVSNLTEVPESTLKLWRKQEWFQQVLREVWSENNELLNTKLTNSIQKAQDLLADRLENGDAKVLKTGEIVRVPISGKDLALITAIQFDKRQILRGEPTTRTESVSAGERTDNNLAKLAEAFKSLADKTRKPEVIDVTDAEIVPDATT